MAVEYFKSYDYLREVKASAASNNIYPIAKNCIGVRIVVAGEEGTGKSSLIYALGMTKDDVEDEDYIEVYDTNFLSVPSLLQPFKLLLNFFPDPVQATIVDTSSSQKKSTIDSELKNADAIILTFDCARPQTLQNLKQNWLNRVSNLELKTIAVPLILVGCKSDLVHNLSSVESDVKKVMKDFPRFEKYQLCSARLRTNIETGFYDAHRAVLFPEFPLFIRKSDYVAPSPQLTEALRDIFNKCDGNQKGYLTSDELSDLQVNCFMAPLLEAERKEHGTISEHKFIALVCSLSGRLETIWTLLRKYGYDDGLALALPPESLHFIDSEISNVGHGSAMADFRGRILALRHGRFIEGRRRHDAILGYGGTICWPVWQVFGSPPWSTICHRQRLEHAPDQDHDWAPTAFKRLLSAKLIKFICLEQQSKKEVNVEEEKDATPISLKDITSPVVETHVSPAPTANPGIEREIPEDQRGGLFKWILEEKRKIKPKDAKEKQKIDEEKALLKNLIRSKSIPHI